MQLDIPQETSTISSDDRLAFITRIQGLLLKAQKVAVHQISINNKLVIEAMVVDRINSTDMADMSSGFFPGRGVKLDNFFRRIDKTLTKINSGTFGICENPECGELIEEKRLEVQPWAALCVSCQGAEEKRTRYTKRFA